MGSAAVYSSITLSGSFSLGEADGLVDGAVDGLGVEEPPEVAVITTH